MTNKQPTHKNRLAGKETSLHLRTRQVSESHSNEVSVKKYEIIKAHVTHFVTCLRDAYSFKDPMEVVSKVTKNLFKLFPNVSIEKLFKWFYGNSLGWATNITDDVSPFPEVDQIGLNSLDCLSSCKIFGGRLSQFLRSLFRRMMRHTSENSPWKRRKSAFSKAQTFLMFKKGSPQVSEELISEAEAKHKKAMSNKQGALSYRHEMKLVGALSDEEIVRIRESFEFPDLVHETTGQRLSWADVAELEEGPVKMEGKILDQCQFIIDKLFKSGSFRRLLKRDHVPFPSTSAHSDRGATRRKGGGVKYVSKFFSEPDIGGLVKMTYHPRTGVKTHYQVTYPDAAENMVEDIRSSEFIAKPVYLREPLKVRTITKGPSSAYFYLKPIQRYLWSTISKHPIFELIGKPISSEVLTPMLKYANPDGKWLSGDYSAATDNLARWLSKSIWSKICTRLGIPDQVHEIGQNALINHSIHYKDGSVIKQQNGQLMGSPLSFPILCIANAAICLLSFKKKRRIFNRCALRVNGDDCVMCFTPAEKDRWYKYAAFIGMSPSPGKCYYAKDWLQMNSELFVLRKGEFVQIPFINFSLASPTLAKGGSTRRVESLSSTMISFCYGRSPKFVDIWLRRMLPFLKKTVPGLISYFLPRCLGGLGLLTNNPNGKLFTTRQLKVATLFYNNALEGKSFPYQLSSIKGGKANYQYLHNLKKVTFRRPIFDEEVKPVKEFWADRFIKAKGEAGKVNALLWENIVKNDEIIVEDTWQTSLISYDVLKAFNKLAQKVEPRKLETLLAFRGYEEIIPKQALESEYEPRNIFTDITARLTNKKTEELFLF